MENETFSLVDVLGVLHDDLIKAEENVQGDARLFVKEVEVELTFTIEKSAEAGGGLNFKVFGVGLDGSAKGTSGRTAGHRILLRLKPHGDLGPAVVGPREDWTPQ